MAVINFMLHWGSTILHGADTSLLNLGGPSHRARPFLLTGKVCAKWPVIGLLALLVPAAAAADEQQCLAEAMYYEARSQGWRGMLAVGVVIQNRVRDGRYPDNVCGVVKQGRYWRGNPVRHKCQFSYYCDGKPERPGEQKPWTTAQDLAHTLLTNRVEMAGLEDATHYHTTSVLPSWSRKLTFRQVIGQHVFYTEE